MILKSCPDGDQVNGLAEVAAREPKGESRVIPSQLEVPPCTRTASEKAACHTRKLKKFAWTDGTL